jgi:hypothetical protein
MTQMTKYGHFNFFSATLDIDAVARLSSRIFQVIGDEKADVVYSALVDRICQLMTKHECKGCREAIARHLEMIIPDMLKHSNDHAAEIAAEDARRAALN